MTIHVNEIAKLLRNYIKEYLPQSCVIKEAKIEELAALLHKIIRERIKAPELSAYFDSLAGEYTSGEIIAFINATKRLLQDSNFKFFKKFQTTSYLFGEIQYTGHGPLLKELLACLEGAKKKYQTIQSYAQTFAGPIYGVYDFIGTSSKYLLTHPILSILSIASLAQSATNFATTSGQSQCLISNTSLIQPTCNYFDLLKEKYDIVANAELQNVDYFIITQDHKLEQTQLSEYFINRLATPEDNILMEGIEFGLPGSCGSVYHHLIDCRSQLDDSLKCIGWDKLDLAYKASKVFKEVDGDFNKCHAHYMQGTKQLNSIYEQINLLRKEMMKGNLDQGLVENLQKIMKQFHKTLEEINQNFIKFQLQPFKLNILKGHYQNYHANPADGTAISNFYKEGVKIIKDFEENFEIFRNQIHRHKDESALRERNNNALIPTVKNLEENPKNKNSRYFINVGYFHFFTHDAVAGKDELNHIPADDPREGVWEFFMKGIRNSAFLLPKNR